MPDPTPWDFETDVLVAGSGAAALTTAVTAAAHGASVIVAEKSALYGGTSATSGGVLWIPATRQALEAGHADTPEEAFQYVRALSDANVPDARIWAFVRRGREMLEWLERNTQGRYAGARLRGLSPGDARREAGLALTGSPAAARERTRGRFRPPAPTAPRGAVPGGRVSWTLEETGTLLFRAPGWIGTALSIFGNYFLDFPQRLHSARDRRMTLGNALLGRLEALLTRAGGEVWFSAALSELIRESGRVTGALLVREGREVRVGARRAVVLAAGGFERNAEMRRQYLPQSPEPRWSGSQENNVGDALLAGMRIGAATLNMDSAWWGTSMSLPGEERARLMAFERALPGAIMVNGNAERYMNEAADYHVAGREMLRQDSPAARTIPSHMLFDARWRRSYPLGPMIPDFPDWMRPASLRSVLVRAESWEELARRTGLPAQRLEATIARFNEHARAGVDPDFRRGESAYDRYYGDPRVRPNPTLRALETPPYYALPVYPGDIGTNGGLATDEHARVLDESGQAIPGLYACGNTAATVMGHSYPAAGATLGPGMTFGYIAALHALA